MDTTITHKRIEYIDALRGFTMLLVIFSHVELFGFGLLPEQSALNTLFIKFRMPLFFFISGFLVYRVGTIWTGNYYLSVVQKKLFAQIVPTLIFGLLYTYLIQHQNILTFIAHPLKMGYWFTISLFEILVIYYTINYLAHILFPSRENGGGWMLMFTAIALYVTSFIIGHQPAIKNIVDYFCINPTFRYFQFFAFGNIIARYRSFWGRLLDNHFFTGSIIIIFTIFFLFSVLPNNYSNNILSKITGYLSTLICNYSGLMIVFAFFRRYQTNFTSDTRIGARLQYIGRRTLDIYLLHYFLIPTLPFIGKFFNEYPNILLELVCGISISLLIAGACLLISNIIRISNLLGHYLFGAKITPKF